MIKRIISSIPNTITCCNLLSGALACIVSFHQAESNLLWGLSGLQLFWLLIACATVFDFCDGLAARTLHAYSAIGKELDSLADLISFGLAPGLMMYNLLDLLQAPLGVCLLSLSLPVFGALRLAAFNVDTRQTVSFIGLPIPSNAIFWIGYSAWLVGAASPIGSTGVIDGWVLWLTAVLLPVMALMMVCDLPMFSLKFKNLKFNENKKRYAIIIATVLLIAVFGVEGLSLAIMLYIIMSMIEHVLHVR